MHYCIILKNLAVPARTKAHQPSVLAGKRVFYKIGCNQCHRASYIVTDDPADATNKATTNHLAPTPICYYMIWVRNWQITGLSILPTAKSGVRPPLWGIGLTYKVSGHTYFLHDGRARNLLEAIFMAWW